MKPQYLNITGIVATVIGSLECYILGCIITGLVLGPEDTELDGDKEGCGARNIPFRSIPGKSSILMGGWGTIPY